MTRPDTGMSLSMPAGIPGFRRIPDIPRAGLAGGGAQDQKQYPDSEGDRVYQTLRDTWDAISSYPLAASVTPVSVIASATIWRGPNVSPNRNPDPITPTSGDTRTVVAAVEAGTIRNARNHAR
jgi:hypothetical protein